MCISWKLKGWILLINGVTMKFILHIYFYPNYLAHRSHVYVASCYVRERFCGPAGSAVFFFICVANSELVPLMYMSFHVKCCLFSSHFNKTWICGTDYIRNLQYKIYERPYFGNQVVLCAQVDRKLMATSCSWFVNIHKNIK